MQILRAMAERRNSVALPSLATKYGFRLPPAEDCLIAPNVQFHPRDPPANMDWEEEPLASGMAQLDVLRFPADTCEVLLPVTCQHSEDIL